MASSNSIFEYKNKYNTLINKYGKTSINISYIDMKNDFVEALSGPYISTAAYYRIALSSLLPNLDRIIYCDSDVINFKDLTEMYNLELNDTIYMRGGLDFYWLILELNSIGITTDRYMNSGILLMNLRAMRINGVEEKIRKFIQTKFLNHHDQTAINGICYKNWDILPIKYTSFVFDNYSELESYNNKQDEKYQYSENELKQAFYEPTLIHYAGWVKPWHHKYSKSKGYYWWYYAKQSGFFEEILNHYEFDKKDVKQILSGIPQDGGFIKKNFKKNSIK